MKEIPEEDYAKTLQKLFNKKFIEVQTDRSEWSRKSKLFRYLVQKGYERDMVMDMIKESTK